MILPEVPDRALTELGRTEGGPDTLALLVRDQDTRRLLMLRAVLDAAEGAEAAVCSAGARRLLREDWGLLAAADGDGDGVGVGGMAEVGAMPVASAAPDTHLSPARARLLHPLVGPWARDCLRGLDAAAEPRTEQRIRQLAHDLAHFSALAAVAAARAGIPFAVRLTARDGVLVLPSLGALRTAAPGDVPVDLVHRQERLTLRQPGAATNIVVRLENGVGAWSGAPAWTPAYALPGLRPGAGPMPLDDLDPYRTVSGGPRYHGLSGPTTLDDAERKRWLGAWSGTATALRLGGEQRVAEAVGLLRCLVPLAEPPCASPGTRGGSCSGTRRDAFGAVLSSTPPTPATFAATLVHELQHAKLAALGDMLTLHRAGPQARYFAPWRPDPRPYNGLLQGAYSHLALADFFQRSALTVTRPAHRESAWALHARYREQVGAVLPALVGSGDLTVRGRRFVDQMVAAFERLDGNPAPRGHVARAKAYVEAAHVLWEARWARSRGDFVADSGEDRCVRGKREESHEP